MIILVLLDFLRQGRGLGQSDEGKIMKKKKKEKDKSYNTDVNGCT